MVAVYGLQSYEGDMRLSHSQYVVKTVQNGRTRGPVYPPKSLEYYGVRDNTVQCSFASMEDEICPVEIQPVMIILILGDL